MDLKGFLRGRLLRWVLTLGVIVLIFSRIDTAGLQRSLGLLRWEWFAVSFAVMLVQGVLSAWALSRLMRAIGLVRGFREVLGIQYASYFYAVLGAVVGGAVRWRGIAGEEKKHGAAFFAILMDNFLMGLAYAALFLTAFFWEGYGRFAGHERRIFLAYSGCLTAIVIMGTTMLFYPPVLAAAEKCLGAWKAQRSWARNIRDKGVVLTGVWRSSRSGTADVLQALAAWFLHAALMVISMKAVTLAVGMDIGWETAAWVCALSKTIQIIPVTFFGLGVTEGIMMFVFTRYGHTSEQAFLAGFQLSAESLMVAMACGVWMTARLMRR